MYNFTFQRTLTFTASFFIFFSPLYSQYSDVVKEIKMETMGRDLRTGKPLMGKKVYLKYPIYIYSGGKLDCEDDVCLLPLLRQEEDLVHRSGYSSLIRNPLYVALDLNTMLTNWSSIKWGSCGNILCFNCSNEEESQVVDFHSGKEVLKVDNILFGGRVINGIHFGLKREKKGSKRIIYTVMAKEVRSGETLWSEVLPTGEDPYTHPVMRVNNTSEVAVLMDGLNVYNLRNGKMWKYGAKNKYVQPQEQLLCDSRGYYFLTEEKIVKLDKQGVEKWDTKLKTKGWNNIILVDSKDNVIVKKYKGKNRYGPDEMEYSIYSKDTGKRLYKKLLRDGYAFENKKHIYFRQNAHITVLDLKTLKELSPPIAQYNTSDKEVFSPFHVDFSYGEHLILKGRNHFWDLEDYYSKGIYFGRKVKIINPNDGWTEQYEILVLDEFGNKLFNEIGDLRLANEKNDGLLILHEEDQMLVLNKSYELIAKLDTGIESQIHDHYAITTNDYILRVFDFNSIPRLE